MPKMIEEVQRPVLVGEANPYGADPRFALYPMPEGSAGQRLCCIILGMYRKDYLEAFDRVNLCPQDWSMSEALHSVAGLLGRRVILLGSKVCQAFSINYEPFLVDHAQELMVLPHPSGRNRMWNVAGVVQRTRAAVVEFMPEIAPLLGRVDHHYAEDD